jgi:hypothetical protein
MEARFDITEDQPVDGVVILAPRRYVDLFTAPEFKRGSWMPLIAGRGRSLST